MCAYREGVDIAELLELEHQGWSSLGDRSGADFYGRLMTPDGVMVLAHGQVLDRAEVVTSLNDAPPWRTYEISDERLVEQSSGPGTGVEQDQLLGRQLVHQHLVPVRPVVPSGHIGVDG